MRTKYFFALTIAVLLGGGMLVFANPPAGSGFDQWQSYLHRNTS